ncbi:hypothetical protein D3C81_1129650 [compost metagenome]
MVLVDPKPSPADFQCVSPRLRGLLLGDLRHDVGFIGGKSCFFTGHGFAPPVNAENQQQGTQDGSDTPAQYWVEVAKFHVGFLCLEVDQPDESEPKDQQYAGDPEIGFQFR